VDGLCKPLLLPLPSITACLAIWAKSNTSWKASAHQCDYMVLVAAAAISSLLDDSKSTKLRTLYVYMFSITNSIGRRNQGVANCLGNSCEKPHTCRIYLLRNDSSNNAILFLLPLGAGNSSHNWKSAPHLKVMGNV